MYTAGEGSIDFGKKYYYNRITIFLSQSFHVIERLGGGGNL